MKKLIAIDPGSNFLGYSTFDITTGKLIGWNLLKFNKKHLLHRKLKIVYKHFMPLFDKSTGVTEVALENVWFTHRNAIPLLAVIHEIKAIAKLKKVNMTLVNVSSVRKHFGLKGYNIKKTVQDFVVARYPLTASTKYDITDSILVALYMLQVKLLKG